MIIEKGDPDLYEMMVFHNFPTIFEHCKETDHLHLSQCVSAWYIEKPPMNNCIVSEIVLLHNP